MATPYEILHAAILAMIQDEKPGLTKPAAQDLAATQISNAIANHALNPDLALVAHALKTATGVVCVAAAAAPAPGDVLTATSDVLAEWQPGGGGGGPPAAHAASHEPGGGDALDVDAAAGTGSLRTLGGGAQQACAGDDARLFDARWPLDHAAEHEPGGGDEMEVDATAKTGSLRTLGPGSQQACPGDDARLNDARTPTSHAASHNAGGGDALDIDAAAGTGSLRTIGSGALQACAGDDARLSDARTPTAHAASHNAGGGDALDIDAAAGTGSLRTLGSGATAACAGNDARLSDDRYALGLKTATTYVNSNTAAAPAAGQVLTATAADEAEWQTPVAPPSASSSVTTETAFGQASDAGTAATFSRGDHTHGTPAAPSVPSSSGTVTAETSFGAASDAGTASTYSRGDHTHGTPADPLPAHAGLKGSDGVHGATTTPTINSIPATGGASVELGAGWLPAFVGDAGAGGTKGAVPAPAAGDAAAKKFLKADGTWTTPTAVTPAAHASTHDSGGSDVLASFTGDAGAGGKVGFVPAPAVGDAAAGKVLGAGGGWVVPSGGQVRLQIVEVTANDVLVASDSLTTFIATDEATLTLPDPTTMTSGDWFDFINMDANTGHYLKILCDSGSDTIRYLTTATAAGGYFRTNSIGSKVRIIFNPFDAHEWLVIDLDGTWTYDS